MAVAERKGRPVVVVVDDEQDLRLVLRLTLGGPRVRVLEGRDGRHALTIAQRFGPRVIVLDWLMPGLSGIEVLAALRAHPVTSRTPVVMLTSRTAAADRRRAIAAGATAFLVKPFSPLELCRVVEGLL